MIEITMLNGRKIVINADLIERLEKIPETALSLTNGKKLVVADSVEEIIDKFIKYKQRINGLPKIESFAD